MYRRNVDFILDEHACAIEVKAKDKVQNRYFKGLRAFAEEYTVKNKIIVSNDPFIRQADDIVIYPWKIFLEKLWVGEMI